MEVVEDKLSINGGFGGSCYTFIHDIHAISDSVGVAGRLASFEVFGAIATSAAYIGGALKPMFLRIHFLTH